MFCSEDYLTEKKQEVSKRPIPSYSYQSTERCNPQRISDYTVDKVEDDSVKAKRMFLHALTRAPVENSLPPTYPSHSGYYAALTDSLKKHKTYYHVTSTDPPKKNIAYNVMRKFKKTAEEILMSFM